MIRHFEMFDDKPQWKVWLFSDLEYVISDMKGIMINHGDRKRVGCAVFQNATGWQSSVEKRMQLFIYVHELGHCFNLRHAWTSSQPCSSVKADDSSTLSWMNYPWRYYLSEKSYGEEAFWKFFDFQFSDSELFHLRHAFRNDIIFGATFSLKKKTP